MNEKLKVVLDLFKIDLGINHSKRDELFINLIEACNEELEGKGVALDLGKAEDVQFLCDYSVWKYRTRHEDVPLSQNLRLRLMNKKVKGRAKSEQA